MKLIAPPLLVDRDETGAAVLIRGKSRVRLPSPQVSDMCLNILAAFRPPGQDDAAFKAQFPEQVSAGIAELVAQMRAGGFLVPAGTPVHDPTTVFWADHGQEPDTVAEAASKLDVTLVGRNRLALRLAEGLAEAGIAAARRVDDPCLRGPAMDSAEPLDWDASEGFTLPDPAEGTVQVVIACTDIGAETHLRPWNAYCVNTKRAFLPVSIKDNRVAVGPYVRPFESACFECARGRVNANAIGLDRSDEPQRPERPDAFGWHPMLLDTAATLVSAELLRQAVGALPPLTPDLVLADPVGRGTTARHKVLRLPRCPVCSSLARHATPMVVDSEDRNTELMEAFK
jgi:bacteriocin biosynthesis cyclodehydratase domain-containing protein